MNTFLGQYLGHFAKTIITIVVCAPLKLLRTWAIVRGNRSSLRNLVSSIRSVSFASWGYYVSTLLACEAVELLVISPVALPFRQTAQDLGVIPQQPDEATTHTNSTWILALFAAIIGPVGIVVFLEWFPATVICVRAALSLLDPGYGGGHGLRHDIRLSLRLITSSLCGKLALYYCLGMIATAVTRASLLVINWVFNLIMYLRTLES